MSMPYLTPAIRLRRTPFSRRVEEAGATAYTVYNHMLLASFFRSVEEDYTHLKSAVQIWDVSCERQVEIIGPDAWHVEDGVIIGSAQGLEEQSWLYWPGTVSDFTLTLDFRIAMGDHDPVD